MKFEAQPGDWPRTVAAARAWQERLQASVVLRPLPGPPGRIAGVDVAYEKEERRLYGAAVVLAGPDMEIVAAAGVCGPVPFPYIPGFLSFREAPILQAAVRQLAPPPDVILVDGQGLAHPRGLGLASHLGLLLGIPTIGCAKSRLWGDMGELGEAKGSFCPLTAGGQRVGWVLRSRRGCRPLFISADHLITLEESLEVVRQCLGP
ncbi:MAG: endonuclease V, partial [Desulfobacca sp.]|uniref:endonuclease V n=1 Tax=Desulfobacca sp. TaxID=2067990 RepID=UPI00404B216F